MTPEAPAGLWTWKQFNCAVDELCPLEKNRLFGQLQAPETKDGGSVYYRKQIRQAVLDLTYYIPEFCKNNETIYYNEDFAPDGEAHVGTLPPMSKVESAWFYSVDKQRRFPVEFVAWEHRFKLTHHRHEHFSSIPQVTPSAASLDAECKLREAGWIPHHNLKGRMAISPKHDQFYLTPQVEGEWLLSLFWDGKKLDYRDAEQVPFEEEAAQAVAWYVQAQFLTYVERDGALGSQRMAQYNTKRSNLFIAAQEKGKH